MEYIKFKDSKLEGFEGPIFPINTLALNYKIEITDLDNIDFDKYCKSRKCELVEPVIVTSDFYTWSKRIEFKINDDIFKKEIVLLIPFKSGIRDLQRSCAFYVKGDVKMDLLEKIAKDLSNYILYV
jgi:hypothetical protein